MKDAPPHPITGCLCAEGRVVRGREGVIFLPPVHDCRYIAVRNSTLVEAVRLTALDGPLGTRWTSVFMANVATLTARALRAEMRELDALEGR